MVSKETPLRHGRLHPRKRLSCSSAMTVRYRKELPRLFCPPACTGTYSIIEWLLANLVRGRLGPIRVAGHCCACRHYVVWWERPLASCRRRSEPGVGLPQQEGI
jgi:hypothetical protein